VGGLTRRTSPPRRRRGPPRPVKRSTGHTHTHTDREHHPRHRHTHAHDENNTPNEHLPQALNNARRRRDDSACYLPRPAHKKRQYRWGCLTVCTGVPLGPLPVLWVWTVARPVSRVPVLDSARHASRLCGAHVLAHTRALAHAHEHDGPRGLSARVGRAREGGG